MKSFFRCSSIYLLLMVLIILGIPQLTNAAEDYSKFIVENLQVEDVPNDDGSGLIISWKPLPKERRIIEYRVYRGVTPDSMFFIQNISVNVKTGVAGDAMYYYDKDYNYFLDLQASGGLDETKVNADYATLYEGYPRDLEVVGPELNNYDILGVIPEKDFFYKNKKIIEKEDDEDKVYAGLQLYNFAQMAKKLKTDKKYYYTVVAVSESRQFYPPAEPTSGYPRDNAPEKIEELFPVFVKDLNRLQFEFSLAKNASDHKDHNIYLLEKDKLNDFQDYIEELKAIEKNDLARKENPEVEKIEPTKQNPAQLIFQRASGYPYTPQRYAIINLQDNKIIDNDKNIEVEIEKENLDNYLFVFSITDWSGYETFSDTETIDIINSKALPKPVQLTDDTIFKVIDNEDDRGHKNKVIWGRPVVYLTNSSYLNDDKTKLLVNYAYNTNNMYKIKNIFFTVKDKNGNVIDEINEFYQDKKIRFEIEPNTEILDFEMSFKTNKQLPKNYSFNQQLIFNEETISLKPGKLYLKGEELELNSYYIYKKNYSDNVFRLSKRVAASQRSITDNISYENSIFKLVSKYDLKKDRYLISPAFSIRRDYENDTTIRANLYPEEMQKELQEAQAELEKYNTMKDTASTEAMVAQAEQYIDYYKKQIEIKENNPILKKAATIKSKQARIRFLQKSRMISKRSFSYKMMVSDGKGHFVETDIYRANQNPPNFLAKKNLLTYSSTLGKTHFYPKPNWFEMDELSTLIASLIFGLLVYFMIKNAKRGKDLYIRPIAGIQEIDNAIGRATEMGRPILFVPGLSGIRDVATLAGLSILGRVAKQAAEYDTKILVPVRNYIVLPIAQEIVKEAHYEAGRPDTYDRNSVFFITTSQFAFVAGVNGVMIREKTATNFYMGMFWAESLIMTETGAMTGAIQIAGTDAITQLPFFITTCDYTLIGEELYAASAYLANEPLMLGTLKAQDYFKLLIIIFVILGTFLSTTHLTFLINSFPKE